MTFRMPTPNATAGILPLRDPRSADPARVGSKAARLAMLLHSGLPVPEGFVCTIDAATSFYRDNGLHCESPPSAFEASILRPEFRAILSAAPRGPWAVRSSAVCEDLPWMSYAGLYRTVLDVEGSDALCSAVRRCWGVISSPALSAYRAAHRQGGSGLALALLVQRQLATRIAGVACSRDPLTGDDTVVISAVLGSSEPLLGGLCDGEVWIVGKEALCQSSLGVLSVSEADTVAALVREVATQFSAPQEVEWAFEGDQLHLLQARPLTNVPSKIVWRAPLPGAWLRHIRLGEWIGSPLTPLAASWLLPSLEHGASAFRRRWVGLPLPEPSSVLVNGWYYASVEYVPHEWTGVVTMLARMLFHLACHPRRGTIALMGRLSDPATRLCLREWNELHAPSQQRLVHDGARRLPQLDRMRLRSLVNELIEAASNGFSLVSAICGAAWKAELLLAEYCRRHIARELNGAPQRLLCGLVPPLRSPHAVFSLDWREKTVGETALHADQHEASARSARAAKDARQARAEVLDALATRPFVRNRFKRLLDRATELAVQRSRCIQTVTEGWPLMRRALLALGTICVDEGRMDSAEDVFFLDRVELDAFIDGHPIDLRASAAPRRLRHRLQQRLTPPLQLGELPGPFRRALQIAEVLRQPVCQAGLHERLMGLPASPGCASGSVRILLAPTDIAHLRDGEVAVVPLLVPGWVPLIARAAAVVADTGNHLMHACVLAREIGLPCVLGLGDATARLLPGELVSVDGARGTVERMTI
jgi:phosphohistidine swiveling domain-containing protein